MVVFRKITGKLVQVAFKTPAGPPSYDFEIKDRDDFGITGRGGLSGDTTVQVEGLIFERNTFTISGATVDGTYSVKLWVEFGV